MARRSKDTQPVTICDPMHPKAIQNLIVILRGTPVLIDRDLAILYGVETKVLNQAVKRNVNRFPEDFRFQISPEERSELVTDCDRFENLKHSSAMPYAFTEQGVAMLSTVLHSETAIKISIDVMNAFVSMRHFISVNTHFFKRLEAIEYNQLEMRQHLSLTDKRIEEVFQIMEKNDATPAQGIFYDGQIYDAYSFISRLIRRATCRIVLIDNYIDDTVLTLLDKRGPSVTAKIYTAHIRQTLLLDLRCHNAQYAPIDIECYEKAHDRFLIIDEDVYHVGASIKDIGKKLFAFSLMNNTSAEELLSRIQVKDKQTKI